MLRTTVVFILIQRICKFSFKNKQTPLHPPTVQYPFFKTTFTLIQIIKKSCNNRMNEWMNI